MFILSSFSVSFMLIAVMSISDVCNHYSYTVSSVGQLNEVIIDGCTGTYSSVAKQGTSEKLVCDPNNEDNILAYGWDYSSDVTSGQCDLNLPYSITNISDTFSSGYSNIDTICAQSKADNCDIIFIKEYTSCGDPHNTGAGGTYTYNAYYDDQCVSGKKYTCLSGGKLSERIWWNEDGCSGSSNLQNTYEETACFKFTCSASTTTGKSGTGDDTSDAHTNNMWNFVFNLVFMLNFVM
eukprot:168038_1